MPSIRATGAVGCNVRRPGADAPGAGLSGLPDNAAIGVLHLDRGTARVPAVNPPAPNIVCRGDGRLDQGGTRYASLPGEHERS